MKQHADHHDAELLLRLYDLRREAKLRQARQWLLHEFHAQSSEEVNEKYPPGSEPNAFLRMVVSYWDMVASIVNRGLINQEFFFENTGEFFWVWEKVKKLSANLREIYKNPNAWNNLERLAAAYEKWLSGTAPEAVEAIRERIKALPRK